MASRASEAGARKGGELANNTVRGKQPVRYGTALYDYKPLQSGKSQKIELRTGDVLEISHYVKGEGWWWGRVIKTMNGEDKLGSKQGYFPSKYVKLRDKALEYKPDDRVKIIGLEMKFPQFNGKSGVIKEIQDNGLVALALHPDGIVVRVRPTNLQKIMKERKTVSAMRRAFTAKVSEGIKAKKNFFIKKSKPAERNRLDTIKSPQTPQDNDKPAAAPPPASGGHVPEGAQHVPEDTRHVSVATHGETNPDTVETEEKIGDAEASKQKILQLERENRQMKLKLRQIEQDLEDTRARLAAVSEGKGETSNTPILASGIPGLISIDQRNGWSQECADVVNTYLQKVREIDSTESLLNQLFNPTDSTFKLDFKNPTIAKLVDWTVDSKYLLPSNSLKIKIEDLKGDTKKSGSSDAVAKVKKFIDEYRPKIGGSCKELWQNLMDAITQTDLDRLSKLASSMSAEDDAACATAILSAIINPLTPLFNSVTEDRLDAQSKLVQECLRKINTYGKQAAEERAKKSAKSFVVAKKLDKEGQEERIKLLKHVQRYKDIITCSAEFKSADDVEKTAKNAIAKLDTLLTKNYHNPKDDCNKDLKKIQQILHEMNKTETISKDAHSKTFNLFVDFLEEDRKERKAIAQDLLNVFMKERERQAKYLDRCFSELVHHHEHVHKSRKSKKLIAKAKNHASLIAKRMRTLDQGRSFLISAKELLHKFCSQALQIIKTQQLHINRKKGLLEELYGKEYKGLRKDIKAQETKLRERMKDIEGRIKKKEKELQNAVDMEDVDDIEECENMIIKYKGRQDKMTKELEEIMKMKQTLEKNDF
ncbi:hypothetical protein AAMO2058_000831400 [Amorphochlora amoebiformis]